MNVLIRLCFILVIGFFGANKTLNATAIPSLDFGSFSMPITANFSDGALNVFKWFEKHPSVGVKVGRLANQDDTIFNSSFHCDSCRNNCPYRYFYKEYITKHNFCRIAHRIFMVVYGRVLLFLWCSLFELFERLL
ncbi:hypothetical protein RGC46_07070 [Helicobacter pylori]|uniref:hypothetical protein n=1 Tax=Helicobacter pylori TaxID=210 RepID=UPI0029296071|nr:hypothetical protein [Helicobacter pylori]MDU9727333.1 hypothetical protein [Helicobacter pylori]